MLVDNTTKNEQIFGSLTFSDQKSRKIGRKKCSGDGLKMSVFFQFPTRKHLKIRSIFAV